MTALKEKELLVESPMALWTMNAFVRQEINRKGEKAKNIFGWMDWIVTGRKPPPPAPALQEQELQKKE